MTQPYYPPQPPMQQPAVPQYPQQPQQSQFNQSVPQYPQQPQQYGYPQQPQFVQPPPQPLVQGTLSDFFNQPSTGGGPVFSWRGKPFGTTYGGIVSRPITNADIQQQTMPGSTTAAYYRDGRPKFLMKVPLTVTPTTEFPDGTAQWWVSGSARDELARAMAEAGCGADAVPEAGAAIVITLTGERPSGPGMNPSKTYRVQYRRPVGVLPADTPVHGQALANDIQRQMQQQQPQPGPIANIPAQVMQQMQPVMQAAMQEQQQQPVTPQQPVQQMPQQPVMPQQPQQQASQQQMPQQQPTQQPNDGLDDAQRKLLEHIINSGGS